MPRRCWIVKPRGRLNQIGSVVIR
ncbi:hypothetical protein [Vreelandella neptunia]